jgi:adenine-specific DNA methylase
MPPGVFPYPAEKSEEEVAAEQVKMLLGGVVGNPGVKTPEASPELQRLHFDILTQVANPDAANGSPFVLQWRFTDAEPWHLVLDNGSTRAEAGEAPSPNVTIEASWADWIASGKPDADRLKMIVQRRIRPRGKVRDLARMRKVFG